MPKYRSEVDELFLSEMVEEDTMEIALSDDVVEDIVLSGEKGLFDNDYVDYEAMLDNDDEVLF